MFGIFIAGVFLGVMLGVVVMALCFAASKANNEIGA